MGKTHRLQSLDVAINQFAFNCINRSDLIIPVDDREGIIFSEAYFNPCVCHGFAEKELNWSKAQKSPAVDLDKLGTFLLDIRFRLVVWTCARNIGTGRCFHAECMVGAHLIIQPSPLFQLCPGLCHIGRYNSKSLLL